MGVPKQNTAFVAGLQRKPYLAAMQFLLLNLDFLDHPCSC